MAYDKVVDSGKLESDLKIVGDAIRTKGGTTEPLEFPQGMADAVAVIEGGGGGGADELDKYISGTLEKVVTKATYIRTLNFSSVKEIVALEAIGYFYAAMTDNKNLEKVDFHKLDSFGNEGQGFKRDPKLTAIIIRTNKVLYFRYDNQFDRSDPMGNGTGYFYVPKALVEQYKVATNWVKYADQIRAIEDYPEITGGAK